MPPGGGARVIRCAPEDEILGLLDHPLNPDHRGVVRASVANDGRLDLSYLGPQRLVAGVRKIGERGGPILGQDAHPGTRLAS